MLGMHEEEHTVTEMNAHPQGSDTEIQQTGETTHIGRKNNLLSCVDNLLVKLMVINEWKGFSHFLLNTQNLHLDLDECIRFLKKHSKFVETALMYIRMKHFEEAIQMCATFLCVYNRWLRVGEVQQKDDPPESSLNVEQTDQEWNNFFMKQKFTKNVEKGTALYSLLKEMYNILIVLNDSIHMMDIKKSQIKKLFENAFPFLIRFNESAFFDFIISRNILLKPEEILNLFKKMEKDKLHIKGKQYMQKYITTFLKHEKMNKEVNTGLVEFYLNDVEMPEQVRQKKILRFLRSSYPLDVAHLARMVPRGHDSLVILIQQSLCICEKYCLYHSLLFKDAAKRMGKEDHDKLFASLYRNEKEVYRGLYEQMRKRAEEDEQQKESNNSHVQKKKQTCANRANHVRTRKKKLKDAFISGIMKNYHKEVYIGMEKGVLGKLDNQRRGGKNRNSQLGGENDEGMSNEKNEYSFMLSLMEQEREMLSEDDLSELYYDDGDATFVKDVEGGNPNFSGDSWSDVCLDKYNDPNIDEEKKEIYKNYVTYLLNKYSHHGDFENGYILDMIPKEWALAEVLHFVTLNVKKKTNRYMDLHHCHNLVKANYLSASYELIGSKEQRLLVKDKLICQVCKGPIAEKRFAYFSAQVVTHMQCLEKYEEEAHR
ncbi:hypothetical protein PCYB_133350 [Plasmodium cynomolgi strain B]|uniref:Uncharacterized protein n=1 Tax=Plasmodium cynomolgi (strain B) TaxID=1120755 RepID=K6UEJ5_PLACD|nr:hypothetical protein PCYB_133350 [Plasmodium cynomolgi strain B]GAB68461.1 hypothetical protein PCYB_133350 [Plasmodium cynomolgi strain B]